MKKIFSKKFIKNNKACYSEIKISDLIRNEKNITIKKIFLSKISLTDKIYFFFRNCNLKLNQKIAISYELAKTVAVNYNKEYPGNPGVNNCLIAIEQFKKGDISNEDLRIAVDSAHSVYSACSVYSTCSADSAAYSADSAAHSAVHSAYSAYSACSAADSAAHSVHSAAYSAAHSAEYAAHSVAYSADSAALQKKIINFILNFIKNN